MISEAAQERATLYALGLLDAGEAGAFEREQDADAELRVLAAELREAAAELARADDGIAAPPTGLKRRVLGRIEAEEEGRRQKAEGRRPEAEIAAAAGKIVAGPGMGWLPWALAACLMISCGVLAMMGARWRQEAYALQQKMSEMDVAMSRFRPAPSVPPADALRQVVFCPLEETHDATPKPRAAVLWDAVRREGVLRVEKLPPPGAGKDYQLWAVEAGHKDTVNAGVVSLGDGGSVEVRFAPASEGGKDQVLAFAISVERAGGSPKNEGPVVFLGKL